MDLEAQILQLLARLRTLKAAQRSRHDITTITTGMTQVKADIADLRTEMRQDLAALGDELAALRRHINEHFTSNRPRCCKDPATTTAHRSAHDPDPIAH
ncbi:hypothetical protein ABT294_13485 [Nonomuraea sp. NPDC000554]|uniref:hypothetical protein n=1 Tax=Nonomuraea sp. NPDC000554 TaxID=3154259 RepID=UPI00331FC703